MTINRTRALFCDLLNLPRGKYVAPHVVANGGHVGFARAALAVSYDRDLLQMPGTGVFEGVPDMDLVPDAERRLGWQDGVEIALGDLHARGEPFGLCARGALRRTVAQWQERGLTPKIGIELEAYVFERGEDGTFRPYGTPGAFVYGTGPQNDPAGLMDAIWTQAHACDIPIESMNGEYDNGQFELTLCFGDAIKACDDAFLLRVLAREIAAEMGLILTFLPKPIPERGGSGVHVNFSFADKNGDNAIAPTGTLSDVAKGCVAGLLHHHEALAGVLAANVNSYDRLTPASMAGYWCNWADDHRMTTVRTTVNSPKSARLEHRMADGSANPYLAVHAVLQAAMLGVEQGYDCPAEEDLDCIENVRATRHVPTSLKKAVDALDKDSALRGALGALLVDGLVFIKRDEAKRLESASVDEVRDFYLPFV
ncbi:glutamine synthetase family protein [Alphaproteobacteria bacterium]|nr:glutamine synthetase family protein [Alphaproteobacteria bacterium]